MKRAQLEKGKPRPAYITPAGIKRLRDELKYLYQEKRPEVTRAVSEAAALGDRSENAEYIYGKKQLREIDRRIRFLSVRLDSLTVVDRLPDDRSKVFFSAWVTVEDEAGDQKRYRIVGPDESTERADYISVDAPLARALLGKQVDDEAILRLPGKQQRYWISAIDYDPIEL